MSKNVSGKEFTPPQIKSAIKLSQQPLLTTCTTLWRTPSILMYLYRKLD